MIFALIFLFIGAMIYAYMHNIKQKTRGSFAWPQRFCWTRFGTEAGEAVASILARKEQERVLSGGLFLWGIGNSIGPAVQELVRVENTPQVLFSPMRSKAKDIDVSPSRLFAWTRATTVSHEDWSIPDGLQVVSRANTASGELKSLHYALVCRSVAPLRIRDGTAELFFDDMENLLSQNKLGHSQVTSVVRYRPGNRGTGAAYTVGLMAELVYPYFVHLHDPELIQAGDQLGERHAAGRPRARHEGSLLTA